MDSVVEVEGGNEGDAYVRQPAYVLEKAVGYLQSGIFGFLLLWLVVYQAGR